MKMVGYIHLDIHIGIFSCETMYTTASDESQFLTVQSTRFCQDITPDTFDFIPSSGRKCMSQSPQWLDGRPIIPVESLGTCTRLKDWLSVGPFKMDPSRNFQREQAIAWADSYEIDFLNGEQHVRPVEGMKHGNPDLPEGSCSWQRLPVDAQSSMGIEYPQFKRAVAYAATYLSTETEQTVAFFVNATTDLGHGPRLSTIHVILDGVVVGRGDSYCVATLSPGEHCLVLKCAGGGEPGEIAWLVDVIASPVSVIDGTGIGLVRSTGFWQGDEENPNVEIEALTVNFDNSSTKTVQLSGCLEGQPKGKAKSVTLDAGSCRGVRFAAPLGSLEQESSSVLNVECDGNTFSVPVEIPTKHAFGVLHVMEGFHCDPVWVSDQHHYNLECLENVRQLMDGCVADNGYRAFLHEIDYLKSFVDEYSDYRDVLFDKVKNGQACLGSSYSEPNENNCSGEAIVRNVLYGYGYHKKFLGGNPGVYHAWDVFGHTPQLSQILAKSGLSGALWSKDITGMHPISLHMSPDGTMLPHIRTQYGWETLNIDHLRKSTAGLLAEKQSFGVNRHLVVDCGDFTCPTGWMAGHTEEMAESYPRVVMTGPEDFLQKALEEDQAQLRITSRDITQYHIGTFLSRSELKVANRLGENTLGTAEKWATVCSLMGVQYPDLALDKAWRQILFGQHHDALTGTPCDMSYLDLMIGYREALDLATDVVKRSTQAIADAVDASSEGTPVVVFNPLNWKRTDLVTVKLPEGMQGAEVLDVNGNTVESAVVDGEVTFVAADIPSVGYSTFTVRAADSVEETAAQPVQENVIENDFWKITLDPAAGGGIVSLVDKSTGEELVDTTAGPANDFISLREKNKRNEPSWEFWTTGDRHYASQYPAKVDVETTPFEQTAVITGELNTVCRFRRTLTLKKDSPVISASVEILDYMGEDDLFVVTVNPALKGSLPTFEDRFTSVATKRGRRKFDYRTWRMTPYSDCAVHPMYNWVDAGWSARIDAGSRSSLNLGSMGLITSHNDDVVAGMTDLLKAFANAGVTCTPMFDDDDAERKNTLQEEVPGGFFQDLVVGRRDDLTFIAQWMAVSVAGDNDYVNGLLERRADVKVSLDSQVKNTGWGIAITEDDDVPEKWGRVPVVVLCADSQNSLKQAVSWICGQLAEDARIRIPEDADLRSAPVKVSDDGFAMLSTGTGAAAMEPDGTLTLLLTHTANWSDNHLNRWLIPEHRTMIYHYGFLPHKGCWRDADLVRAGYELNVPMTTVLSQGESGALPVTASFLEMDSDSTVVTAMKPFGNPVACFESAASDARKGITLRAYNADGRGGEASVRLFSGIESACAVNLMEEVGEAVSLDNGQLDWSIGPYSIETLKLESASGELPTLPEAVLGAEGEGHPVWCRYWQHNVGAHPMGYLPMGIYIDGDIQVENKGGNFPTIHTIRVTVNNNLTDSSISGVARLSLPEWWTATPAEIPYDLEPRGHQTTTVTISMGRQPRVGLVRASMEYAGQTYYDMLEAGRKTDIVIKGGGGGRLNGMEIVKEREPEWSVMRDGDDILVKVANPWWQPLTVELAVASPLETWESAAEHAVGDVSPRHTAFTLPGKGERLVRFTVTGRDGKSPHMWAWAKLMCNGKPDYRPVPGTTA